MTGWCSLVLASNLTRFRYFIRNYRIAGLFWNRLSHCLSFGKPSQIRKKLVKHCVWLRTVGKSCGKPKFSRLWHQREGSLEAKANKEGSLKTIFKIDHQLQKYQKLSQICHWKHHCGGNAYPMMSNCRTAPFAKISAGQGYSKCVNLWFISDVRIYTHVTLGIQLIEDVTGRASFETHFHKIILELDPIPILSSFGRELILYLFDIIMYFNLKVIKSTFGNVFN